MKRTILVSLALLSAVILAACGQKSEGNIEDKSSDNKILSTETTNMTDCTKAVEDYLAGADKDGQGEEIKAGDNIVVDYIGRLDDGTVFDTSVESIARACGKYNEGRDYTQGLSFEVGAGQMIKGFDNGVIGMKLGQTKTVKFGPDEGYGQRNEEYVLTYTKEEVGDLSQFEEGQTIYLGIGAAAKIIKVTDKDVTLDLNHELAGKDLIFDITIKSIN